MLTHRTPEPGSPSDRPSRFELTRPSRAALVLAAAVAALASLTVPAAAQAATTTTIPVGAYPWEVAADPATGLVYVTNEDSNTVSVINEATDTVVRTIRVGRDPQGIAVDAATGRVYVTNFADNSLSVIHGRHVTTITGLGTDPDAVAVDAATDTIYVSGYLSSNIFVINGHTNALTGTPITVPGANIHDLAVDPATGTLYASAYNLNYVALINTGTNAVTGQLTGLQGPDGLAFDAITGDLYVAMNYQSADRIAVYRGGILWKLIRTRHEPANGRAVAVDARTGTLFASLSATPITGAGSAAVINRRGRIITTVTVGDDPNGIAVDPATGIVFVANSGSNTVTAFAG
jgi:YVTN family beta-propeller protein